jgi:hypothetical protein
MIGFYNTARITNPSLFSPVSLAGNYREEEEEDNGHGD